MSCERQGAVLFWPAALFHYRTRPVTEVRPELRKLLTKALSPLFKGSTLNSFSFREAQIEIAAWVTDRRVHAS